MDGLFKADFTGTGNNFTEVHPVNWKDVKIKAVYANYADSGTINAVHPSAVMESIQLEFIGQDAKNIYTYRNNSLTTGGLAMGIPFQMIGTGVCANQLLFNGVINISDDSVEWECDRVKAPLRMTGSIDWLYDTLEGIDFVLLRQYTIQNGHNKGLPLMGAPGSNALFQYKPTCYNLVFTDELLHVIMMILEEETLINKLWQAIKTTTKTTEDLIADVALGLTILYTVVGVIKAVTDVIAFIFDVVRDLLLFESIVGMTELMLTQVGLINKYKYAMLVTDIMDAIFAYINDQGGNPNLTFTSSIFGVGNNGVGYGGAYATTKTQGVMVMPKKIMTQNQNIQPIWQKLFDPITGIFKGNDFINGLTHPLGDETNPSALGPPYGCPDGNAKDWILGLCTVFNASTKLINTNAGIDVQFEEIHYWNKPINFTIPNTGKPGFNRNLPDPHKSNWKELAYNTVVAYRTDKSDGVTLARYNGTTCNALVQPATSYNILNWLVPGNRTVNLPYAQAKPKEWLSLADNIINDILDVISLPLEGLTAVYNGIVNILNQVIKLINKASSLLGLQKDVNIPTINFVPYHVIQISIFPYLQLTNDTFEVPKIFIGEYNSGPGFINTRECWQPIRANSPYPDPNGDSNVPNEDYMSADVLTRLFHSKNFLTPSLPPFDQNNPYTTGYSGGNQWFRYLQKDFKMCCSDFFNILLNGNVVNFVDGQTPAFLEELEWNPHTEMAENAAYRVNAYTLGLQDKNNTIQITIDGTTT